MVVHEKELGKGVPGSKKELKTCVDGEGANVLVEVRKGEQVPAMARDFGGPVRGEHGDQWHEGGKKQGEWTKETNKYL